MKSCETNARRYRTAERKGSLEKRNGKWRIVCQVNGKRIRKNTGTSDKREAERIRREWMSQFVAKDEAALAEKLADIAMAKAGKVRAAEMQSEEALPSITIADAAAIYLADTSRKLNAPTTSSTDENTSLNFGRFFRWCVKHHPEIREMRQFTASMAAEYTADLYGNLAPNTAAHHIATLKRVWKVLGERAKCHSDPWAKIKKRSGVSHRRENFTEEQVKRIFAAIDPEDEMFALCSIGMYTGLRLGDAATLKWSAVDFEEKIIEVLPMKVKKYNHKVRIPISDCLLPILADRPRTGEYVLPEMAKCYLRDPSILTYKFSKLVRSVGLEPNIKVDGYKHRVAKYGFHSWRHSFVIFAATAGISISVIQEIVGHLSPDMTQHYYHLSDDAARDAIRKLPDIGTSGLDPTKGGASAKLDGLLDELKGLNHEDLAALRDRIDFILSCNSNIITGQ